MTIKQTGGIFGRNPTFNDVTIDDSLTTAGNIISSEEGINTPTADGITVERPTGSASPTPVELRMSTTTAGSDWSTTDPWGRVAFYNKDTSGGGGKVHASMEVRAAHSSGGRSRLAFKTNLNSGDTLADALVIDPDQGSGRHVTVSDGNLVIGTSGKGIDFSATSGTGTSELFDDYEEGTWTPTLSVESGTAPTHTVTEARYTKIGRQVHAYAKVNISAVGAGLLRCNFPFTPDTNQGIYGNARMKNSSNNWRHTMLLGYNTSFFFFAYDDNATYYVNSSTLATGDISFMLTYNV